MLVWIDLEMTGLDAGRDHVLEIATVITDDNLSVVGDSLQLVIDQPPEVLSLMGDVVSKMHHASGLTAEVRLSTLSLEDAQRQTLDFIRRHVPDAGRVPLCGNSIGIDRRFLNRWLPEIEHHLHYHVVDVTSIKELAVRWYPTLAGKRPRKKKGHRALDDILESIDELKYWRSAVFAPGATETADGRSSQRGQR